LSDKGKDELALLVAQKKVVAFRDQDFADLPIDKALDFGRYFGRLHIHPTRYKRFSFSKRLITDTAKTVVLPQVTPKSISFTAPLRISLDWSSSTAARTLLPGIRMSAMKSSQSVLLSS